MAPVKKPNSPDADAQKGAVETETRHDSANNSTLNGQLGHRDADEMLKEADSGMPEPGSNPEHSGQHK
jgi:hypothetical protein